MGAGTKGERQRQLRSCSRSMCKVPPIPIAHPSSHATRATRDGRQKHALKSASSHARLLQVKGKVEHIQLLVAR